MTVQRSRFLLTIREHLKGELHLVSIHDIGLKLTVIRQGKQRTI